jgi:FkbM family methyltransferase
MPSTEAQHAYPHVPCVARELMWEREDGLRIFFDLRDLGVGHQICQGTFDPEVETVLARLAGPGVTCLDIGANLGFHTLVMARAGADVHAFEALPYNHALLERNVAENRVGHLVRTHQVGCASAPGTGRVLIEQRSINLGSTFVLEGDGEVPDGHLVQPIALARVDDLVPASASVDLVKIDVEGAELDVLRGMPRVLERDRPVIVMEINSTALRDHRGTEARDLMAHLFAHGYRAAEARSLLAGDPLWVVDIPEGLNVFANVVCWDESRHVPLA